MLLRIALFLFLMSFIVSLIAKAQGRVWMVRLFIGGFCVLLLWGLIKVFSRVI